MAIRGLASKPTYSERMEAKGRPVSPDIVIYAFPIVAFSSITVRITGCMLSVGCCGVAAASLVGADVPGLMMALGNSSVGPLAKFSVSYPLIYHFLGGARHAYWDQYPEVITNASVEQSSYALIGLATAASVGLSMGLVELYPDPRPCRVRVRSRFKVEVQHASYSPRITPGAKRADPTKRTVPSHPACVRTRMPFFTLGSRLGL